MTKRTWNPSTHMGRLCAICGKPQSPRLGGLAGYATKIQLLREAGVKLAIPDGRYLHHGCLMKVHKK